MIVTSSIGIFISMLIYLLVGTIGYILYGNKISDSILDSMGFSNFGVLENISFVVNVVMSFPLGFSAMTHYLMFLVEIIVTLIRDSCAKKAKKKDQELLEKPNKSNDSNIMHSHTSSIKNVNHSHNNKSHIKEKKDKKDTHDKHNTSHTPGQEHGHTHNHAHGHMALVHIPEYAEYLIMLCVFLLLFYTANSYPNMKIVNYLLIIIYLFTYLF